MKNISVLYFIFFCTSLFAQDIGLKLPVSTLPNTTLDVNGSVAFQEGGALILANGVNSNVILSDFNHFRITGPTSDFSITGFNNGKDGRILTLLNTTSNILTLSHLGASLPENQINTSGTSVALGPNGVAILTYNTTLSQWVLTGGQGFKYNWTLTGNAGTLAGTHFIGTTGEQALSLKANNTEGVYILPSGKIGMGTQSAQNSLDVEGRAVIGATYSGMNTAPANGLLVEGITGLASSLKIGASPSSINASSALEIESTTKGFVPPRMTTAQMSAIASPLEGSIVFNTTLNCLHQYKSTGWTSLCNTTTIFTQEALQTSILTQSFGSSFTNIPGVSGLSINFPRTGTYTIIARAYFASDFTTLSDNSGAQGSFKILIDGTSYEESYLTSVGIHNSAAGFTLYGLGTQGMIIKTISLTAGVHTISMQGRTWSGTNCTGGTWGIDTTGYVNSNGVEAALCKLTIVEN
jgi:hypothetical protein